MKGLSGALPNILILFADDLGSGDLQSYGHPTTRTPELDKLAFSGVRFTQWYSGFHVCSPSRASMMTGRLPIRSGTAGNAWTGGVFMSSAVGGLPHNETTLPEVLGPLGYATKAIGKVRLHTTCFYLSASLSQPSVLKSCLRSGTWVSRRNSYPLRTASTPTLVYRIRTTWAPLRGSTTRRRRSRRSRCSSRRPQGR